MDSGVVVSALAGWLSIVCWIAVYSPQVVANYKLQSGEALSVRAMGIWILGDITNLAGALATHMVPTAILLAFYYLICDFLLLGQIFYYRWRTGAAGRTSTAHYTPLHSRVPTVEADSGDPALDEHAGFNPTHDAPTQLRARSSSERAAWAGTLALLALVFVLGAWSLISTAHNSGNGAELPSADGSVWKGQLSGWLSAVIYSSASVSQISKNFETRCTGLAVGVYFISIAGELTFLVSILAASTDPLYLRTNASWLTGSVVGTALSFVELWQIYHYRVVAPRYSLLSQQSI